MKIDVLTLFPEMFRPVTEESILGRAAEKGILDIRLTDIRDFSNDKHNKADDYPFGGGGGMVMMADPMIISLDAHVYQYSIRPNSISTNKSQGQSRRFATDLSGTLVRIESILKDYKNSDPLLYYSCRKSIETRLITLFSRTLSSDFSKEEFKAFIQSLKAAGLLPLETDPSSKLEWISRSAISFLSRFPGIFSPAKWMFRHFFLPIAYPRLLHD